MRHTGEPIGATKTGLVERSDRRNGCNEDNTGKVRNPSQEDLKSKRATSEAKQYKQHKAKRKQNKEQ